MKLALKTVLKAKQSRRAVRRTKQKGKKPKPKKYTPLVSAGKPKDFECEVKVLPPVDEKYIDTITLKYLYKKHLKTSGSASSVSPASSTLLPHAPSSASSTPVFGLRFLTEILDFPIYYGGLPTAEKVLRPKRTTRTAEHRKKHDRGDSG